MPDSTPASQYLGLIPAGMLARMELAYPMLREGLPVNEVCAMCGILVKDWQWVSKNVPEISARIEEAKAFAISENIKRIAAAGGRQTKRRTITDRNGVTEIEEDLPGDWKANDRMLEILDPGRFGSRGGGGSVSVEITNILKDLTSTAVEKGCKLSIIDAEFEESETVGGESSTPE